MEEGRGTRFDPAIIDVFLENRDRVKEIALLDDWNNG